VYLYVYCILKDSRYFWLPAKILNTRFIQKTHEPEYDIVVETVAFRKAEFGDTYDKRMVDGDSIGKGWFSEDSLRPPR